jgi:hypothetical protein
MGDLGRRGAHLGLRGAVEAIGVLLLLVLTLVRSLSNNELQYYDETSYLARGVRQTWRNRAAFSDGATYSDLYWVLGHFVDDKVDLYFLGRALAAVALVVASWLAARLLTEARLAWVVGVSVAAGTGAYIWPSVSAPATGLLLVGLALALRWPGFPSFAGVAACAWLAAGARPEYVWFAALASGVALLSLVHSCRSPTHGARPGLRDVAVVLGGAILVPTLLVAFHGSPFTTRGRQWFAFIQHYSLRNAQADENPWLDSVAIASRSFGEASGFGSAIATNPDEFLNHMAENAMDLPSAVFTEVLGIFTASSLTSWLWAALILGLVVSIVADPTRARQRASDWAKSLRSAEYRIPLILLAAYLASVAIPVLVIYPRGHYLLGIGILLILLVVLAQYRVGDPRVVNFIPLTPTVIAFGSLALSTLDDHAYTVSNPPVRAASVRALRDAHADWRLLGSEWGANGIDLYVPNLELVNEPPVTDGSFGDYLEEQRVSAVLLPGGLDSSPVGALQGFSEFAENPADHGFVEIVPDSGLWVRPGAISRPVPSVTLYPPPP